MILTSNIVRKCVFPVLLLFPMLVFAQVSKPDSSAANPAQTDTSALKTSTITLLAPAKYSPTLSLGLGILGPNLQFNYPLGRKWSVGLQLNFSEIPVEFDAKVMGIQFHHNIYIKPALINIMGRFYPKAGGSFHFTAGAAANLGKAEYGLRFKNALSYNEVVFTPEQVGKFEMNYDFNKVWPYLGIGLGRMNPKKRFGFCMEMGCYYSGSPKLAGMADKLMEPTTEVIGQVAKNVEGYQFFPNLNFQLVYKLNK